MAHFQIQDLNFFYPVAKGIKSLDSVSLSAEKGEYIVLCAEYADMVSMFLDGQILTTDTPRRFFGNNSFYTTAGARMSRHVFSMAATAEDVVELCRQSVGAVV